MKKFSALALCFAAIGPVWVLRDEPVLEFDGGIGVVSVSRVAGAQNPDGTFPNAVRNDVRGIAPGGQPWVIAGLEVAIDADGTIHVDGEGLLLAGGNGVGTNANQSVIATLICGPLPNGPFTFHSTDSNDGTPALDGVPLDANGDFEIEDILSPAPPVPCENPVLLIRSQNGAWFAAGIPKTE